GRRFAAARHANDRGFDVLAAELRQPPCVALRAEQALERRLFGAEVGPLAALQPIFETQPVHEYGVDQVGDLLAHKRYFFSCGTTYSVNCKVVVCPAVRIVKTRFPWMSPAMRFSFSRMASVSDFCTFCHSSSCDSRLIWK